MLILRIHAFSLNLNNHLSKGGGGGGGRSVTGIPGPPSPIATSLGGNKVEIKPYHSHLSSLKIKETKLFSEIIGRKY